jgi:hypothetical protein
MSIPGIVAIAVAASLALIAIHDLAQKHAKALAA